jgi:hypothetical protein
VNDEFEGMWKEEAVSVISDHFSGIYLEGLSKISEHLSEDNRSLSRDFNPGPAEYEAVFRVVCVISITYIRYWSHGNLMGSDECNIAC